MAKQKTIGYFLMVYFGASLIGCYGDTSVGDQGIEFSLAPEQIHLAYPGQQSSMFVTWTTMADAGNGSVTYWKYGEAEKRVISASKSEIVHTDDFITKRINFVYRAEMVDLEINTKYQYQVQNGANESEIQSFRTFPEDKDFLPNIAVYGDMGVKNGRALPKVIADTQNEVIDMVLHIGDLAYDMNERLGKQGDLFMNMVQPVASKIPYNVLVGNHEEHNNFSEFSGRFTSPGPSVFYNSFNVGPLHIIMFSSEFYFYDNYGIGQLQAQYNWLVEDLAKANTPEARAKQPWIIAMAHRPMYCSSYDGDDCTKRDSIMRTGYKNEFYKLEDLFFNNSVDLQVYGHEHDYERSLPIYDYFLEVPEDLNYYQDPKFPVHIISGAGGCREIHDRFSFPQPLWSVFRRNVYGFIYLKAVDRLTLNIKMFSVNDGVHIDNLTIAKSSEMPRFNLDLLRKKKF